MKQPKNLGLLVCLTILLNIEPAFGMFDPTVRAVEMYFKNDTSFIDASGLKVRKVNRTQHVISGPFYVNVPIGNEYTYITYSYKKGGNEFKKLPYKFGPLPFCQYVDEEKLFFEAIRAASDLPPKGTCPWPKGKYNINNYLVNIESVPPVFSSGEYKLEAIVTLDGKIANGLNLLIDLISIL